MLLTRVAKQEEKTRSSDSRASSKSSQMLRAGVPMIDAVSLETLHLFGPVMPAIFRLRHRIFVARQRYDVPTYQGMEWDAFDTPATVYFVWRDETGEPRGVARLIPTAVPYMVQQLWPELIEDGSVPSRESLWEITRLGIDRDIDPAMRRQILGELLCAFVEYAMVRGIDDYIFVTAPQVIEGTLSHAGIDVRLLGQHRRLGRFRVVAAMSPATADVLAKLRRYHGICEPVLRLADQAIEIAA
jgi:acyl homoserine lactone synthase